MAIKGPRNSYESYGTGVCATGQELFLPLKKRDIDFFHEFNYGTKTFSARLSLGNGTAFTGILCIHSHPQALTGIYGHFQAFIIIPRHKQAFMDIFRHL